MSPRFDESHAARQVRIVVHTQAVAGEVTMVDTAGASAIPAVFLMVYADAPGKDIPDLAKQRDEADDVFTFALSVELAEGIATQLSEAARRAQA